MPQENLIKVKLKNFTSLRNWELDSEIPPNCLFDTLNSEFDGGIWKSIHGCSAYLPGLAGGSSVMALSYYPYKLSDMTDEDYLVEYYNKAFYLIDLSDDSRAIVAGTTFAVDEDLYALNYNNAIYFISPNNGIGYIENGGTWGASFTVQSAHVTGGSIAQSDYTLWTSITNGSFHIIVDGIARDVTAISFSGLTSMGQIAAHIQAALRTVTGGMETIEWITDHFVITSGSPPSTSQITETSTNGVGTDISGDGSFGGLGCNVGEGVVTLVNIPPVGTMLEIAAEKMWSAGDPLNRNLLTYSRTATAGNPEHIRDYTNGSGKTLVGDGGVITGLKKLKNTLYVFKEDSIYYLSSWDTSGPYAIPLFEPYAVTGGCINPRCVVQVENDLWFMNRNLQLRSLGAVAQYISDTRTTDVSLAIKRFLDNLDSSQPFAAMSYFKNVLKVSLRTKGSFWNDWVLTYDFNNGGYSVERLKPIKMWAETPSQRYFCESADSSGKLFKDSIGYSMDGEAFSFSGRTGMVDAGDASINKRLRYVKIYCGRSDEMELNLSVYKDSYGNLASSSKVLAMPTIAEMGGVPTTTGGAFGEEDFGEEVWGGSGELETSDVLPIYRKVFPVDQNLTGRMFGIEINGTIYGTRAEIYMIELGLIPLPDKNIYTTN